MEVRHRTPFWVVAGSGVVRRGGGPPRNGRQESSPYDGVLPRPLPQPGEARLGCADERLAVDGDESEGRLPVAPLEVVEQAPVQVPAHVDAVRDCRLEPLEGAGRVGD